MLLDDPRLRGLPLLVVASKCDMLQLRDRTELERLGWAPLEESQRGALALNILTESACWRIRFTTVVQKNGAFA